MLSIRIAAFAAVSFPIAIASTASADAFNTYGSSFDAITLPGPLGTSFGTSAAALADGRLIAVTGDSVFVESAVGSGVFDLGATLSGVGSVDPSFLEVSPDGSRIAVGGGFGLPMIVFDSSLIDAVAPGTVSDGTDGSLFFTVNHFDAAWRDNDTLAFTAGDFVSPSYVDQVDVTSGTVTRLVDGIDGGSAGIAFDSAGRLYTGNGFDFGPGGSETGEIRAFDVSAEGSAIDFITGGMLIAEVLSAASLNFDADGNLFIGGGDFAQGDSGYAGVLSGVAIQSVFAGGSLNAADLRALDPRGDGFGFFGTAFNQATGTLYIADGTTLYATVPNAPTASAMLLGGLIASKRRRVR